MNQSSKNRVTVSAGFWQRSDPDPEAAEVSLLWPTQVPFVQADAERAENFRKIFRKIAKCG